MKYEIIELEEKTVVGFTKRMNNSDTDISVKISSLWEKFNCSDIKERLNHKCIGLYSNYNSDFKDDYNITVCCEVDKNVQVSTDMVKIIIPAGRYAKFVINGDVKNSVMDFWVNLWNEPIKRRYEFDFEEYQEFTDSQNAIIHIYISI